MSCEKYVNEIIISQSAPFPLKQPSKNMVVSLGATPTHQRAAKQRNSRTSVIRYCNNEETIRSTKLSSNGATEICWIGYSSADKQMRPKAKDHSALAKGGSERTRAACHIAKVRNR